MRSFTLREVPKFGKYRPEKHRIWTILRSGISYNSFPKALLNFIRPGEKKIDNIYDQVGKTLLSRLR